MWGRKRRTKAVRDRAMRDAAHDIALTEEMLNQIRAQDPEVDARTGWLQARAGRNHFAEAMFRTMGQKLEEEGR